MPKVSMPPCPRCGGDVAVSRSTMHYEYTASADSSVMAKGYVIICNDCPWDNEDDGPPAPTAEEAVAAWSGREQCP